MRTFVRGGVLTVLSVLLTGVGHATLVGCGGAAADPDPFPASEPRKEGEHEPGDPGDGPRPPPPVEGAPVDGVFVSSTKGHEDGDGSSTRPLKTLGAGIALAKAKDLPLIACAETYREAVELADGVAMYGYFDCSNPSEWKRVEERAKIVAPSSPAVLAEGLASPTRLEGFEIAAPDFPGTAAEGTAAATSYGMIVRASRNLALAKLVIRAGKGQDGTDGAEAAMNVERSKSAHGSPALAGEERVCELVGKLPQQWSCNFDPPNVIPPRATAPGASGGISSCEVGPSGGRGGAGGGGRIADDNVYRSPYDPADMSGKPLVETAETAKGGTAGKAGAVGANGKTGTWAFSAHGFRPGDGTAGENGRPGQGGGGGVGMLYWSIAGDLVFGPGTPGTFAMGRGAGGGAGGCGGIAGAPGTGGGASIGLFVVASENVTIDDSRIEANKGGRAGRGTLGTVGTPGNPGGSRPSAEAPNGSRFGGVGFPGGAGGAAGLSGHGAPGPSIALVFHGARPETTGVDLVAGAPGDGAPALIRGAQVLPAVTGEAKAEHSF